MNFKHVCLFSLPTGASRSQATLSDLGEQEGEFPYQAGHLGLSKHNESPPSLSLMTPGPHTDAHTTNKEMTGVLEANLCCGLEQGRKQIYRGLGVIIYL